MTIFSLKNTLIPILGGLFWTVTLPAAAALAPNEVTELLADDATIDDRFGHTVSIDGDTALIGALGSPPVDMGSAYGLSTTVASGFSKPGLNSTVDPSGDLEHRYPSMATLL